MKKIEEYLNTLYKDDDSKEVKELKEELKEHLIVSTNEFIKQGYEVEEAQNKAIQQFDGGSDSIELRSIYTKKIDVKKERVKKLTSIRFKVINIFGWFLGAAFFTAYLNTERIIPTWLTVVLIISFSILIILSVIIYILKMSIEE